MTAWSGRVPTLASMLRANDEAVSADWAWLVHNMPGSSYGGQPLDDLRASTSRGLRAIIEALHTGFDRALDSYLKEISLCTSTWASRSPRSSRLSCCLRSQRFRSCGAPALPTRRRVAKWPTASCAVRTGWPATLEPSCGREQPALDAGAERRTILVLEAVRVGSNSLDLHEVLRRVPRGIVEAVGVRHCGIYH